MDQTNIPIPETNEGQIPTTIPVEYPYQPETVAAATVDLNCEVPEGDIPEPPLIDTPTFFVCPNCNFCGETSVEKVRGLCSMLMCFSICWGNLFFDYQHSCPQCRTIIGTYESL